MKFFDFLSQIFSPQTLLVIIGYLSFSLIGSGILALDDFCCPQSLDEISPDTYSSFEVDVVCMLSVEGAALVMAK
jgi:hypothetical protein